MLSSPAFQLRLLNVSQRRNVLSFSNFHCSTITLPIFEFGDFTPTYLDVFFKKHNEMKWNHRHNILLPFLFPIDHLNVGNCFCINQNGQMIAMDERFLFPHSSLESLGRVLMNRFLNHAPGTTSSLEIPEVHLF